LVTLRKLVRHFPYHHGGISAPNFAGQLAVSEPHIPIVHISSANFCSADTKVFFSVKISCSNFIIFYLFIIVLSTEKQHGK